MVGKPDELCDRELDLLIIGGGISGAALAYVATHGPVPLRVGLVEAGDLASGTSARSSRFLHGGLRYLAQGRLGLVRRLLAGRREIARLAPHLVRRAPFLLPLGAATPHAPWLLHGALGLYGLLAGDRAGGGHQRLAAAEVSRRTPLLAALAGQGALAYDELTVADARLVVELALGAAAAGAAVVTRWRCERLSFTGARVTGAWLRAVGHSLSPTQTQGGTRVHVRAKVVVNATGASSTSLLPCAGQPRLRLSRGSHLVLPPERLPLQHTVVFFSPRDRRALFASPRDGYVLVGTTEVPHGPLQGRDSDVRPSSAEIDYLVEALTAAFPDAGLGHGDVAASFAGVRPLVDGGAGASAGALDRGYVLDWDAPGLLAMRGGKLTLALEGARAALAMIHAQRGRLGLPALVIPGPAALPVLPNARMPIDPARFRAALAGLGVPALAADQLRLRYGAGAHAIAAILRVVPSAREALVSGLPYLRAELLYAARVEAAAGFADFAERRSDLGLLQAVQRSSAWRSHPQRGQAA